MWVELCVCVRTHVCVCVCVYVCVCVCGVPLTRISKKNQALLRMRNRRFG